MRYDAIISYNANNDQDMEETKRLNIGATLLGRLKRRGDKCRDLHD